MSGSRRAKGRNADRTESDALVVLVYSTSHALQAEKILLAQGLTCKLIPVPRQLSSDCGVCVRVTDAGPAGNGKSRITKCLEEAGLEIQGVEII